MPTVYNPYTIRILDIFGQNVRKRRKMSKVPYAYVLYTVYSSILAYTKRILSVYKTYIGQKKWTDLAQNVRKRSKMDIFVQKCPKCRTHTFYIPYTTSQK